MHVYFLTWFSVFLLGLLAQQVDYSWDEELTDSAVTHTSRANLFFSVAVLILVFVAGCRYYIGSDYYAYYGNYESYIKGFWEQLKILDEPGLPFIYWITSKFSYSGFACVFVSNAIMIILVLRTMYKNTDFLLFPLMLYSLVCWVATFNGMRQALATAVVFCGFPYLRDRKFIKYLIIIFLGFLCHKSALLMIPLYFLCHRKINIRNIVIIIVVSFICLNSYELLFSVVESVLGKQLNTDGVYISKSVNSLRILTNIAPALLFLLLNSRREQNKLQDFYMNILLFHAIVSFISRDSAYLARMVIFTAPFEVIAICELAKEKWNRNRSVITALAIVLYFLFQTYQIIISPDLSPFQWIWQR